MADSLGVLAPSSMPRTGIVMESSSSSVIPGNVGGVAFEPSCARVGAPTFHTAQMASRKTTDRRNGLAEFIMEGMLSLRQLS
jgi:hypothetical protein